MRLKNALIFSAIFTSTSLAGPCDPATLLGTGSDIFLAASAVPKRVVTLDLNNDSHLDLIVAHWGRKVVSVHLGIGDGTFMTAVEYGVAAGIGTKPQGLAIADFNCDTQLDIAVGNTDDWTATILLGDGSGNFSGGGVFTTGGFVFPNDMVAGDLDQDGDQDLVVSSESNSVRVLENNGDGTFASPVFEFIPPSVHAVSLADINNDNDPDIVAVASNSNKVSILYGAAGSGFATPVPFDTLNVPADVQIADMDDDGDLDLVVISLFEDAISVYLNNGSGDFNARTDFPCNITPWDLKLEDMDSDGDIDAVIATYTSSIAVMLNDGSGNLAPQNNFAGANSARSVAIGDFNGDDGPDVAAVYEISNEIFVYLNQCPPTTCTGCNPADLADPCGVLNFFDVSAFLVAYNAQDPIADFTGDGQFNFFDVTSFISSYTNGCP